MSRLLVVPAAGAGTRLGSALPKLLVPVAGRAMIDWLVDRYDPLVDRIVLVVNPAAAVAVREHLGNNPRIVLAEQAVPTGMLDAILIPVDIVRAAAPDEVWITWCDQVAVGEVTARRLAEAMAAAPPPDLALPTHRQAEPYIHFDRDAAGRITAVRQRREGDAMPADGEGDSGLFALSRRAYLDWLPEFGQHALLGAGTGERNFLPFIPWVGSRGVVATFPVAHPIEATGINTPAERARIEAHLRDHAQHRHPGL